MPINLIICYAMCKILEGHKFPKLTQEVIDNLNSIISTEIIEFVVKNLPIKKTAGQMSLLNSTKCLREK